MANDQAPFQQAGEKNRDCCHRPRGPQQAVEEQGADGDHRLIQARELVATGCRCPIADTALVLQPHPVTHMGWAHRTDQRIARFFLQALAVSGTHDKTKGDVFPDPAAVWPLVGGELGFSHASSAWAWHREERCRLHPQRDQWIRGVASRTAAGADCTPPLLRQ